MPHAELVGVSLYYELSGAVDAPVLMFSNSLGATGEMWKLQLAAFEAKCRVLRYDMRGHGRSSVPAGPYTIDQLGGDAVGLLDHLGIDRVDFCGLSIGGLIGQWLGIHARSRLDRLVLCNTAAKIGTAEGWKSRTEAVESGGLAGIADAVMERWFTAGFRASQPALVAGMREMLSTIDPAGYVAACEALRDTDQRATVSSICTPTLIVAGEFDPATTVEDSHFLHSQIAGAAIVVLSASHISNVEAADPFNAAVHQFLMSG